MKGGGEVIQCNEQKESLKLPKDVGHCQRPGATNDVTYRRTKRREKEAELKASYSQSRSGDQGLPITGEAIEGWFSSHPQTRRVGGAL